MSYGYGIFRNSRRRSSLYKDYVTIRFFTIFPDYTTFKNNLVGAGVDEADIPENDYKMLQAMVGNAWMKWKTAEKNYHYIALEIKRLKAKQKREEYIYNIKPEEFGTQAVNTISKLYTVNKRDDGVIEDDYLANVSHNLVETAIPTAQIIEQLRRQQSMELPEVVYISRLANNMVIPYAPRQNGKDVDVDGNIKPY